MFGNRKAWIRILFVTSCVDHWRGASAFHVDPSIIPAIHHATISISSAVPMTPPSAAAAVEFPNILDIYKQSLATNPLSTKMVTGASLALMGDAIAQSKDDEPYNQRRAFSFMIFDACYRALQHVSFPVIVQQCQGQYIGAVLTSIPYFAALTSTTSPSTELVTSYSAAMEQTLASQLGIVPFLYYPVFYVLTSLVQGLTTEEGIARAKETFIPLMKRNLLFWIPVQFVQFGFIDESLQIPFLSVCGLAWTFILSVVAGDAKKNYCVKGNEDECSIDNDDFFSTTDTTNDMKELEKQVIGVVEKEQQQKQEREQKQLQFENEKEQVLL